LKEENVYRINESQDRAKWRAYVKLQLTIIFYKRGMYSILTSWGSRVEPGYNEIGLSDTSCIALSILWHQLISHWQP